MNKKELKYRKASYSDLYALSEFRKHFPVVPVEDQKPGFYQWKCFENPVMEGELWVADVDGIIVGIKSVTPRLISRLGDVVIAGEMGDSFVHPDYRGRGIFSALTRIARDAACKNRITFMYHTPNQNSRPIYENKLGHAEIEDMNVRSLVYPLNVQNLLKKKYRKVPFAAAISLIFGLSLMTIRTFHALMARQSSVLISREFVASEDFDNLYKRVSSRYDVSVIRDRNYINWRFFKALGNYLVLIAKSEEGDTLGYIVGKTFTIDSVKSGYIADFLIDDKEPYVFHKLLLDLLAYFRREEVDLVVAWANEHSFYKKVLLNFGFLNRSKIPVFCYMNEIGERMARERLIWHFTMADSDNI